MSIESVISSVASGATGGLLGGANEIAKTVVGSQQDRDAAQAKLDGAVQDSYQAEWVVRASRNWFDSLVDGVNRLVRPLCTVGVLALFVWAGVDPAGFTLTMGALRAIPEPLWVLIVTVLGFWFGGRFLQDAGLGKVAAGAFAAVGASTTADDSPRQPSRAAMGSWLERRKAINR